MPDATPTPTLTPVPRPPPPVAAPPFTGREPEGNVARYAVARLNARHTTLEGAGRWAEDRYASEGGVLLVGTPLRVALKLTRREDGTRHWGLAVKAEALAVTGFPAPSAVTLKINADGTANWDRLVEAATVYLARRAESQARQNLSAERARRVWALAQEAVAQGLAGAPPVTVTRNWDGAAREPRDPDYSATLTWRFPAPAPAYGSAFTYEAVITVRRQKTWALTPGEAFDPTRAVGLYTVTLRLCGGGETTVTIREAFRAVAAMSAAAEAHAALTARENTPSAAAAS